MEWEWADGIVLVLILSVFVRLDQHMAQAATLIFFIPTSITAIAVNYKQKLIDWKLGLWVIGFGILGSTAGAFLAAKVASRSLRKYFGIFLAFIAIHEIYSFSKQYILKKKKTY